MGFWGIIIPIICGAIVSIILYTISENKKSAILLVIVSVFCSIVILGFLQYKESNKNIYSNEYVYINYGKLECTDDADIDYPCNIWIYKEEESYNQIHVFSHMLSVEEYNSLLTSQEFYMGMIDGYCVGYAGADINVSNEQIVKTEDRGVWFDRTYVNYPNTRVFEGQVDGKTILVITKVLYVGKGEMLLATLNYENIDYNLFCSSKSKNIIEFRECFNSIEQKMVQVPSSE